MARRAVIVPGNAPGSGVLRVVDSRRADGLVVAAGSLLAQGVGDSGGIKEGSTLPPTMPSNRWTRRVVDEVHDQRIL